MKIKLILASLFLGILSFAQPYKVSLPASIEQPSDMHFISSANFLSLNIAYEPIQELRKTIKTSLQLREDLKFSTAIFPNGEAHVTVITPPEFGILNTFLSIGDIEAIAQSENIQSADVQVLGLGSGKKLVNQEQRETFFLIIESLKLRKIRLLVYNKFVEKGGDPKAWDPTWFFPHITIGFTHTDLHEPDVLKNIKHSFDQRFEVKVNEN